MIQGASGISLRFSGYECVKWVEVKELHRPTPHNDPNRPQPIDPIALIPKDKIFHSDVSFKIKNRHQSKYQIQSPKTIKNTITDLPTLETQMIDIFNVPTMKLETCSQKTDP